MIWHRWTSEEIEWLKANYPKVGMKASMAHLGMKSSQIRPKAAELGLRIDRTSEFWKTWMGNVKTKSEAAIRAMTLAQLARWQNGCPHPRGMLGKRHTAKTLARMALSSKRRWQSHSTEKKRAIVLKANKTRAEKRIPFNVHGSWKAGWREVGGRRVFFRSRWEANYARFLEWRKQRGEISEWDHEPETFWFDSIKRGNVSYLPDFKVTRLDGWDEYHEVKGWMDARSKTQIRRMAKYHPSVILVVVDGKAYRKLSRLLCSTITGWEDDGRNNRNK